jgi:hypothetical protein
MVLCNCTFFSPEDVPFRPIKGLVVWCFTELPLQEKKTVRTSDGDTRAADLLEDGDSITAYV